MKEKERHEEREKEKHTIYDISDDVGGETRVAHVRDVQDGHDMARFCRQSTRLPYNVNGQHALEVVHVHSSLCGAHLIPICRQNQHPLDTHYADSLDTFQAYYVNKRSKSVV